MYLITDTFGTRQVAWSWAQALDWLRYTSERGMIRNRFTGRVIAIRVQEDI